MANTGVINFEGTVTAGGTCPISIVNPGGSPLPIINFGDFQTKDFDKAGLQTVKKRFALSIDPATCAAIPTDTTVTFNANHGADPSGKLYGLQTGVGYSEGFAVAIYDKSSQVNPGTPSASYTLNPTNPTEMVFNTNLHTTKAVTEGTIASSVSFLVAIP
ncbi:hypothetical protein PPUN110474_41520 [Pseudomonas putida]|nr:hypothetical protein PPUN110474_41520 [Pseudomonas putida]